MITAMFQMACHCMKKSTRSVVKVSQCGNNCYFYLGKGAIGSCGWLVWFRKVSKNIYDQFWVVEFCFVCLSKSGFVYIGRWSSTLFGYCYYYYYLQYESIEKGEKVPTLTIFLCWFIRKVVGWSDCDSLLHKYCKGAHYWLVMIA